PGLLHGLADFGSRLRRTQVGAGTESLAPARQHDHPDGGVLFGAVDPGVEGGGDVGTPGVETFGAIQRQDGDAAAGRLVEYRVGNTVTTGHLPRNLLMLDRIQAG